MPCCSYTFFVKEENQCEVLKLNDSPEKWAFILNHRCWVTHICVNKLTIFGSDSGLSYGRRQAIIWTNDGLLLIGTNIVNIVANTSKILIEIQQYSFMEMYYKLAAILSRPQCINWHHAAIIP